MFQTHNIPKKGKQLLQWAGQYTVEIQMFGLALAWTILVQECFCTSEDNFLMLFKKYLNLRFNSFPTRQFSADAKLCKDY